MSPSMQEVIYRLRLSADGSFCGRLDEETARRYLDGSDWKGVRNGTYHITASRPDPEAREQRLTGFDDIGPLCHHPEYGTIRLFEGVPEAAPRVLRYQVERAGRYAITVLDPEGFPETRKRGVDLSEIRQLLGEHVADEIVRASGELSQDGYRELPIAEHRMARARTPNRFLRHTTPADDHLVRLELAVALDQQLAPEEILEQHEAISARFNALIEAHLACKEPVGLSRRFSERQRVLLTESAHTPGTLQITYLDPLGQPIADSIYTNKRRAFEEFFTVATLDGTTGPHVPDVPSKCATPSP